MVCVTRDLHKLYTHTSTLSCLWLFPWRLRNLLQLQTYRRSITIYKWVNFEAVCSRRTEEMDTAVIGQQRQRRWHGCCRAKCQQLHYTLDYISKLALYIFADRETIKIRWNSRATTANSPFILGKRACENINKISKSSNYITNIIYNIDRCINY